MDTGLVHHTACLFMPQLSLIHTAHIVEGWPGWVALGGWLHAGTVYPSAHGDSSKY